MATTLTTRQACERLQIGRTTLWKLVRDGRLTAIHLSARNLRYRADEIENLLSGNDDDAATLRAALTAIAQQHADDERPMCTGCGKRRSPKSGAMCQYCDEAGEIDRKNKREWWGRNQPKRITVNGKRVYVKPDGKEVAAS